jgi:Uma2 family endonuclease
MSDMQAEPLLTHRKFTVDEYHRMGEIGILHEDDRVELIDGQLVQMSPVGAPHAGKIDRLARILIKAFGDTAVVGVQNPVRLDKHNEPRPDFSIMWPRVDDYEGSIPTPADLLLLIEVADSSIRYDREVKAPLYARYGVPEYWLLNLGKKTIEVFCDPGPTGYLHISKHGPDDTIAPRAAPNVWIALRPIIG